MLFLPSVECHLVTSGDVWGRSVRKEIRRRTLDKGCRPARLTCEHAADDCDTGVDGAAWPVPAGRVKHPPRAATHQFGNQLQRQPALGQYRTLKWRGPSLHAGLRDGSITATAFVDTVPLFWELRAYPDDEFVPADWVERWRLAGFRVTGRRLLPRPKLPVASASSAARPRSPSTPPDSTSDRRRTTRTTSSARRAAQRGASNRSAMPSSS